MFRRNAPQRNGHRNESPSDPSEGGRMQHRNKRLIWLIGALLGYALLVLGFSMARGAVASQNTPAIGPAATFLRPTYSSPIALSNPVPVAGNPSLVWVVNPDDDLVSV